MRVVGIDVGSTLCGWALLDTRGGHGEPRTATYLDGGMVLSAFDDVGRLFDRGVDLIAIERPEGYAFKRDGKGANAVVAGLVGSSYVAGGIAWLARAEGFRVVELTANAARRTVLGKPSATDKHIKSMVPCLVYGWPKVSNPHQRDAAIVALAASWTTRERQVA